MKMKEFGQRGRIPSATPLDPPMYISFHAFLANGYYFAQ